VVDSSYSGSSLAGRTFERILIVKPSSLGDIVHALPVLHGLRARYPKAAIDWLVASPFAPLLEGHPKLDRLILFDRKRFSRIGRSLKIAVEFQRFVRGLRASRYDLVIDLQGLFRTGFLSRASGARVRIGFRNAREGAWAFYTHRIRFDDLDTHAVDRNYAVAKLLDFDDLPVDFAFAIPNSLRLEASGMLSSMGMLEGRRMVAVVPGARWDTKVWAPERFAETIDAVQLSDRVRCVLIGGRDEVDLCDRITRSCRSQPVNLAGRTSVPQLAAVVGLADVVLCHDSAAMHLAVALGRPLVCLIGPTNPSRTGPYRRPGDVVRLDIPCAPCYLRKRSQCPHDHRCMKDLGADLVISAVERRLGQFAVASTSA